jgi:hypothetical protein
MCRMHQMAHSTLPKILRRCVDAKMDRLMSGLMLLGYHPTQPCRSWQNILGEYPIDQEIILRDWDLQWRFNMRNKLWLPQYTCWLCRGHGVEWIEEGFARYGLVQEVFESDGFVGLIVQSAEEDGRYFPPAEITEVDKECPNLIITEMSRIVLWEDVKESLKPAQLIRDWRHYDDERKYFLNRYII